MSPRCARPSRNKYRCWRPTKPSPRRSTRSSRGPSAGGWNCRNHVANSSKSLRLRSKTRFGPKCIVVVTSREPKTIFERSVRPRTSGSRLRTSPASRHRQDFGTTILLSIRDPRRLSVASCSYIDLQELTRMKTTAARCSARLRRGHPHGAAGGGGSYLRWPGIGAAPHTCTNAASPPSRSGRCPAAVTTSCPACPTPIAWSPSSLGAARSTSSAAADRPRLSSATSPGTRPARKPAAPPLIYLREIPPVCTARSGLSTANQDSVQTNSSRTSTSRPFA
jgi:hypothetical protein